MTTQEERSALEYMEAFITKWALRLPQDGRSDFLAGVKKLIEMSTTAGMAIANQATFETLRDLGSKKDGPYIKIHALQEVVEMVLKSFSWVDQGLGHGHYAWKPLPDEDFITLHKALQTMGALGKKSS